MELEKPYPDRDAKIAEFERNCIPREVAGRAITEAQNGVSEKKCKECVFKDLANMRLQGNYINGGGKSYLAEIEIIPTHKGRGTADWNTVIDLTEFNPTSIQYQSE